MPAWFRIVFLCVAAACVYGIAHDMVTAHVCVEYFTVFHPPLCADARPVAQALAWGGVATWWVGAGLGPVLACCARVGAWPKMTAKRLIKPLGIFLVALFVVSMGIGYFGWWLHSIDHARVPGFVAQHLAAERHGLFMFNWWAHNAAYQVGALGALGLGGWMLYRRRALRKTNPVP